MESYASPALPALMWELLTIGLGVAGVLFQPLVVVAVREWGFRVEHRAFWMRDAALALAGPFACVLVGVAAIFWQGRFVLDHSREAIAEMASYAVVLPFFGVGAWLVLTLALVVGRRVRLLLVSRTKSTAA